MVKPSPQSADAVRRPRRWRFVAAALVAAGIGAYLSSGAPPEASRGAGSAPLFARVAEPVALPEILFRDDAGREVSLADFHGKVVLLNVWATWCPPCRKEMPTLDRLQAKLGGPDFQVVALSIDEKGAAAARGFFDEIGVHALKIYVDPSMQAANALGVSGVPTTLLIDRSGREVGLHLGPAEWDSAPVLRTLRSRIGAKAAAGRTS